MGIIENTKKGPLKICGVQSVSLNKINKYFDGQWQGIRAGSDGSCYFASSTHSTESGAAFFKFNPFDGKTEMLAKDLTEVCGEDLKKTTPQGKVHSPIVEDDGWLYFTSHLSNFWEEAVQKYPGAHVLGYEISSRKFKDFGIIKPHYSVYSAINVDKINKKLYVFSVPFGEKDIENDGSHLYQIDIKTAEKKDLGKVPALGRGGCFWFYIDNKGRCWFSVWKNFNPVLSRDDIDLYCYDPETARIKSYRNVLPCGKLAPDGAPADESLKYQRSWTWAEAINDNKQCLFTMGKHGGGDERLWVFDPSKNIENGEAFRPLGYIGSTFLSVACNKNRVFYIQYKNLKDARERAPEFVREFKKEIIDFEDDLHLRSISLNPRENHKITDHGKITDQDNRKVTMIESLAADDNENVYFVGCFDALSKEESSYQYIWQGMKDDLDKVCDTFKNEKVHTYKLMNRGQFFAHVNVKNDF